MYKIWEPQIYVLFMSSLIFYTRHYVKRMYYIFTHFLRRCLPLLSRHRDECRCSMVGRVAIDLHVPHATTDGGFPEMSWMVKCRSPLVPSDGNEMCRMSVPGLEGTEGGKDELCSRGCSKFITFYQQN